MKMNNNNFNILKEGLREGRKGMPEGQMKTRGLNLGLIKGDLLKEGKRGMLGQLKIQGLR